MAERLIILPQALQDAIEAFDWYEGQQPGLGAEFLDRLDERIRAIQKNPEMYELVRKNYRRALLRKFPYAVYYEIVNEVIFIYLIFHCSQDPRKVRQRLP